jgi:hypothetical protein
METITSVLSGAASLFEGLLRQAHFTSMLLGLIVSFGLTQWVKGFVRLHYYRRASSPHDRMTEAESLARYKLLIRSTATVIGFVVTLLTWPDGAWRFRIIWALAVGVSAPIVYWTVIRWAAARWPAVAAYVSADSKLPDVSKADDDGSESGV